MSLKARLESDLIEFQRVCCIFVALGSNAFFSRVALWLLDFIYGRFEIRSNTVSTKASRLLRLNARNLRYFPTFPQSKHFQIFDLNSNQLRSLPSVIGDLKNLKALWLGNNGLQQLPSEVGHLTALQHLALSANNISELPKEIGNLCSLTLLDVSGNHLKFLPTTVGGLRKINCFLLGGNELDALPEELAQCSGLRVLDAGSNKLSSIPAQLSKLVQMELLNLDHNLLVSIPEVLGNFTALDRLHLENNAFTDSDCEMRLHARRVWIERCHCKHLTFSPSSAIYRVDVDRTCLYANFLQKKSVNSEKLVVSFGTNNFDFGGVLNRLDLSFDILFILDRKYSNFQRNSIELNDFLAKVSRQYTTVAFIGSSQGAYGALSYSRFAHTIFAVSPARHCFDPSPIPLSWPSDIPAKCNVVLSVGRYNRGDMAMVRHVKQKYHHVEIVEIPSMKHGAADLYGKEINEKVKDWLHEYFSTS